MSQNDEYPDPSESAERVEWNPTGDRWLTATVVADRGEQLLVLLDLPLQYMVVDRKHCRTFESNDQP